MLPEKNMLRGTQILDNAPKSQAQSEKVQSSEVAHYMQNAGTLKKLANGRIATLAEGASNSVSKDVYSTVDWAMTKMGVEANNIVKNSLDTQINEIDDRDYYKTHPYYNEVGKFAGMFFTPVNKPREIIEAKGITIGLLGATKKEVAAHLFLSSATNAVFDQAQENFVASIESRESEEKYTQFLAQEMMFRAGMTGLGAVFKFGFGGAASDKSFKGKGAVLNKATEFVENITVDKKLLKRVDKLVVDKGTVQTAKDVVEAVKNKKISEKQAMKIVKRLHEHSSDKEKMELETSMKALNMVMKIHSLEYKTFNAGEGHKINLKMDKTGLEEHESFDKYKHMTDAELLAEAAKATVQDNPIIQIIKNLEDSDVKETKSTMDKKLANDILSRVDDIKIESEGVKLTRGNKKFIEDSKGFLEELKEKNKRDERIKKQREAEQRSSEEKKKAEQEKNEQEGNKPENEKDENPENEHDTEEGHEIPKDERPKQSESENQMKPEDLEEGDIIPINELTPEQLEELRNLMPEFGEDPINPELENEEPIVEDKDGNVLVYGEDGYDQFGRDTRGYDREGYDKDGLNIHGARKIDTEGGVC